MFQIIDESDNSSHEAAMRKWNEKNEDEKYALLITQDTDSLQQVSNYAIMMFPSYNYVSCIDALGMGCEFSVCTIRVAIIVFILNRRQLMKNFL